MAPSPLSARAKHRLKIAAGLLRGVGRTAKELPVTRAGFYDQIQELIAALPEDQQKHLKELTDWVERYDLAESNETVPKR